MSNVIQPFHLLVIALSGWLNRQQQVVIDYLIEENRVLKEQLEGKRLRFTDGCFVHTLLQMSPKQTSTQGVRYSLACAEPRGVPDDQPIMSERSVHTKHW